MAKQFELPYQTWERVTGLRWSEAKKRGYTDGSAEKNLALKESLMNGEWDNMQAMQQAPYKGGTKEPMSEGSIVETLSGAPYKGAIGVPYGANATEEDIATQSEMMSKPVNTGKKKFASTAQKKIKKDTFIDEWNAKYEADSKRFPTWAEVWDGIKDDVRENARLKVEGEKKKKTLRKSTDGRVYVEGFKPAPGIQYPKKQKVSYRGDSAEKVKAFAKKTSSAAKKASQRPWEYLRFD